MGVLIGFESLVAKNLKEMKTSPSTRCAGGLSRPLANLRASNPRLWTFIFGYDHDTHDCFRQTVDFARQHAMYIARSSSHAISGTALYRRLEKENRLITTPGDGSTNDIDTTTSRSARRN